MLVKISLIPIKKNWGTCQKTLTGETSGTSSHRIEDNGKLPSDKEGPIWTQAAGGGVEEERPPAANQAWYAKGLKSSRFLQAEICCSKNEIVLVSALLVG